MTGTVTGIWRYPVKSMRGEQLDAVVLGPRGLDGDRAYALLDRVTGKVASAKLPRLWEWLLACQAVVTAQDGRGYPPPVRITLPDGQNIEAGSDDIHTKLSAFCGRAVTLSTEPPATAEIERYWPDIDGLDLRDTVTSGPMGRAAPPGTFFDCAPVHLITTATLDRLQALYPEGQIDARRFRPNLIIAPEAGAGGFVENGWVGRTLMIGGEVRLRIMGPMPRCVIPTLPQAELPRDVGVLRAVVAHNRTPMPALGGKVLPSLGVYAVVERGGMVRRDDAVLTCQHETVEELDHAR